MNRPCKLLTGALLFSTIAFTTAANAVIIDYRGSDPGAGATDPRPNADAAAASFDAAANATNSIDFETLAVGTGAGTSFSTGGVTFDYAGDIDPLSTGVTAVDSTALGYNTTAGGSNHLRFSPLFNWTTATLTLSFDNPFNAFGAYFTGLETAVNGSVQALAVDGSTYAFNLTDLVGAGVEFFGFTDDTNTYNKLIFTEFNPGGASRDIWGMDDLRFTSVPEPSILTLLGLGLVAMGFGRRKRA